MQRLRKRLLVTSHWVPIALTAVPLVLYARAAWGRRWMSDDGFIALRVVRQLVHGNGPLYNTGERVEAATSPLWVYILAVAKMVLPPVDIPWLAVILGLVLAVAGLALAQWGAYRLWRFDKPRFVVPAGAFVVAATPAFWDFATSGLETGLEFAWLGASFFATTLLLRRPSAGPLAPPEDRRGIPAWTLILIGLGPLVRPDFSLFTIAFLATALVARPPHRRREWIRALAVAFALPVAYEIFRAGYYAELTPNPAFAKEAGTSRWDQGWTYLWDTLSTYWIAIPVALVSLAASPSMYRSARNRATSAVIAAPIIAGLTHGLYTVYVGGDFMHARMMLPAIFAVLMPFSVVAIESFVVFLPLAGVAAWTIVCATTLRPPYDRIDTNGIANERAYYVHAAGHPHPITKEDYTGYWVRGIDYYLNAPPRSLLFREGNPPIPLASHVESQQVAVSEIIGIQGWVLDDDVYILDTHGLANVLGGRMEMGPRGRPGHEKSYQGWYIIAQYTPGGWVPPSGEPPPGDIAQARIALRCGDVPKLLDAISDPMSPGRFVKNIFEAFRLHRFRFSGNPYNAAAELCGDQPPS
jgi:arabinofuranosyltransferase